MNSKELMAFGRTPNRRLGNWLYGDDERHAVLGQMRFLVETTCSGGIDRLLAGEFGEHIAGAPNVRCALRATSSDAVGQNCSLDKLQCP